MLLRVVNWQKFQHYQSGPRADNVPPWIKLYPRILDKYEYMSLPESARLLLVLLWCLAAKLDNKIPADEAWLKQRLMLRRVPDLHPLVDKGFVEVYDDAGKVVASKLIAQKKMKNRLRSSPEIPPPGESPPNSSAVVGSPGGVPTSQARRRLVEQIWGSHLEARRAFFRQRNGQLPASEPTLTPRLRKLIWSAIERHGEEKTEASGRGIFLDGFHTGDNDRNRLYLDPAICWRETPKDHVDEFAELVLEVRRGG